MSQRPTASLRHGALGDVIPIEVVPKGETATAMALIQLHEDSWDDYRFKTLFEVLVHDGEGPQSLGFVKIGKEGMRAPARSIDLVPERFYELDDTFFSVGTSREYYENLAALDPELRDLALASLRDLTAESQFPRLARYQEEPALQASLFRDIDPGNIPALVAEYRHALMGTNADEDVVGNLGDAEFGRWDRITSARDRVIENPWVKFIGAAKNIWYMALLAVAILGGGIWALLGAINDGETPTVAGPNPVMTPQPAEPTVVSNTRTGCATAAPDAPARTDGGLEAAIGVANVSCGDSTYHGSVSAKVDDVVEVQLWLGYYGPATELGEIAVDLNADETDLINARIAVGDEIVEIDVPVELSLDEARLEFLPGSIEMRHNAAPTGAAQQWTNDSLPDAVFYGSGESIGRLRQGELGELSIVARFRSVASGVSIRLEVADADTPTNWTTTLAASPGDSLLLRALVRNEGNQTLNALRLMFELPTGLNYVDDSAVVNSAGVIASIGDNGIFSTGLDVGDLAVGVDRSVTLKLDVSADAAGVLRPIAFVDPLEMARFFNLAIVEIEEANPPANDIALIEMSLEVANPARDTEWSTSATVAPGEIVRIKLYVHNRELGTSQRSDGSSFDANNLTAELRLSDESSRSFAPVAIVDGPDATRLEDHATITVEGAREIALRGVPGSVKIRRCGPEASECTDFPADDAFVNAGVLQLGSLPALDTWTGAEMWVVADFTAELSTAG